VTDLIEVISNEIELHKKVVYAFNNKSFNIMSENILLDSVIFTKVNEFLANNKSLFSMREALPIDLKTLIATQSSIIERPNILKPSEIKEEFKTELEKEGDFIRIARFEMEIGSEKESVMGKTHLYFVSEGVLPHKWNINPFFDSHNSAILWDDFFCEDDPRMIGLVQNLNSIEARNLLWLNIYLLDKLGLKVDSFNNGLRALDKNKDIILLFRSWRDELIGNGSSFVGQDANIAKLEGCDLMLREDYYNKLKILIPSLSYYVKTH